MKISKQNWFEVKRAARLVFTFGVVVFWFFGMPVIAIDLDRANEETWSTVVWVIYGILWITAGYASVTTDLGYEP